MKTTIFTTLAVLAMMFSANARPNPTGENPKAKSKIFNWVNNNIKYPDNAVENKEEGIVYVAFTVKKGEIINTEVVGGVSETLDNAVLNTIQTIPVSEIGVDVNEENTYILPVKFEIK